MSYLQLKLTKFGVWLTIAALPLVYLALSAHGAALWIRLTVSVALVVLAIAATMLDFWEGKAAQRLVEMDFKSRQVGDR